MAQRLEDKIYILLAYVETQDMLTECSEYINTFFDVLDEISPKVEGLMDHIKLLELHPVVDLFGVPVREMYSMELESYYTSTYHDYDDAYDDLIIISEDLDEEKKKCDEKVKFLFKLLATGEDYPDNFQDILRDLFFLLQRSKMFISNFIIRSSDLFKYIDEFNHFTALT